MHLLVRETHGLDDAEPAVDLGLSAADLVLLSFSDSDLGAAAAAWQAMGEGRPTLRLANLARLRHPLSVDLFAENVVVRARCVVVRLLGGVEYWPYGAEEVASVCRRAAIPLAMLPGDGRDDPRLRTFSTVDAAGLARLDGLLAAGGAGNMAGALRFAAHLAGLAEDDGAAAEPVAAWGEYRLAGLAGPAHPLPPPLQGGGSFFSPSLSFSPPSNGGAGGAPTSFSPPSKGGAGGGPTAGAAIVFYRSHLLAGDTAPVEALAAALAERGLASRALFVDSLKATATATGVADTLRAWQPTVILNLTAFSARRDGLGSPLDAPGVPVLQALLSGAPRARWAESARGVSQSDLAMQVALPELDGRLLTAAIAFKDTETPIPGLEFARTMLRPDADGIALAADRSAGWARLATTPRSARRVAIVLSDYPGAARGEASGQEGHAVGLDSFASLAAILSWLREAGYDTGEASEPDAALLTQALCAPAIEAVLPLTAYRRLFATLPETLRNAVLAAWGEPAADIRFRHFRLGKLVLAIQPDRGRAEDRRAGYHDPDEPPCHAYVAFHLWLRAESIHAMVHLGTHGSLEWLPGKAVALSAGCFPAALLRGLPVIYPFIVNNPGEAAMAKRRLGAVTIGHLTPPLRRAGLHGPALELERLIDEFAAADGLDSRRTALLRRDILDRAATCGLLAECAPGAVASEDEQLARLDAYLCDVKEMQIRDGLHIFGQAPAPERRAALLDALARSCPTMSRPALTASLDASPAAERMALLAALDGRMVPPGPSGAPSRGRADVLPTGRNLFALDPRAVPTRSALVLAERTAAELLRRHLQDHGEWPRSLVIDLWGSTTLRTGGEDLALALMLMGARPLWDEGSNRVTGIEIVPLAALDRPRIDVTLRVSGLFRDAFPTQIDLFDLAVRSVAARDEAAEWNPLAAAARGLSGPALRTATARIYGAGPGRYGTGVEGALAGREAADRATLGAQYLAGSSAAYGQGLDGVADEAGFARQVAGASAFLHTQDHAETDVLDSPDYAAHAGGFAAAASGLGATPVLYHADSSDPEAPRLRPLADEIARVVRGRASNPAWIAGQRRHGYRGAAEIARTLDSLHGFASTLPTRLDGQFDLYFDATLGDPETERFLRDANPAAHRAMRARFADALRRDLWRPRRNSVAATLGDAA